MSAVFLLSLACVLDRTGQSASAQLQREIRDNGIRIYNVEQQFVQVEARVNQLEEISRSKNQEKIAELATLEQIREQMARLRGQVEVLSHASGQGAKDMAGQVDDARFRILWLENRADQLERSMGLKTPDPPAMAPVVPEEEVETSSTWGGITAPPVSASDEIEGDTVADAAPIEDSKPDPDPEPEPITPKEKPAVDPPMDPIKMLDSAKSLLKEGNSTGAEALLSRFLDVYPNHSRSDEATYRRAEASKAAKDYEKAVLRYQEVIDQFKGSAFAPWAMFRQGECFEAQDQKSNAKVFYGEVIRIYPKSRAAKAARKQLGR